MKWFGPVAVVALALLAEGTLGRAAGGPDFALFFGRFHPLVVHLPIGFFLLVAMAEAATFHSKLRDRVEPALGLLVPLSALAALAAFLMGQLLALEGGFPAGALAWHRRLTLFAIVGMCACWALFDRQHSHAGRGRSAYRAVLAATLGVLSLGAHFGGTMTRGEGYLSKYAPGPLKPLLGAPEAEQEQATRAAPSHGAAAARDPLIYQDVVQPLLNNYCVECHGTEKQKGKLRVDSLELLLKGGENGAVVVAGNPQQSPLLTRILLPLSDDDHMPPEGKPSPKPEEIALLQFWIERGASPTLKVRDSLAPSVSRALLEHTLNGASPNGSVPVSAPSTAAGASVAPAPVAPAAAPSAGSSTTAGASPSAGSADITAGRSADGASADAVAVAPTGASAKSGPAFLALHCEKCHGAAKQKGKLRVDSVAAMVKGGANGSALLPGKPEQSAIVQRVRLALGDEEHMPPKKELQPSAAEIAALVAWIRSGAAGSASAPAAPAAAAAATEPASLSPPPAGADATPPAPSASASASATPPSSAPALARDVSGPPDAALLRSLPSHVVLFEDAVQPLFRGKCGKCHIRDKPAGGLGVEQRAQLVEGGYSGAGVVPKNRQASLVMQRLLLPTSNEEHMPPPGEPELSADETELVGAWIDQGAPATAPTATASLTAGAVRALSALGIKSTARPEPTEARAGGCAACSVPGAPRSKWLWVQALGVLGAAALLFSRRSARRLSKRAR